MAMPSNKRTTLSTKAALPDGTIPLEGETLKAVSRCGRF
jgi:hypothetical protein